MIENGGNLSLVLIVVRCGNSCALPRKGDVAEQGKQLADLEQEVRARRR